MELNITNARKQFEQLEKMEPEQQPQQQQHKQHAQAQLAPGGAGVPLFAPSPVMPMPVTALGAPPFATQPAVSAVAGNGAPLAGVGVSHAQIFSATGGAYLPGQTSQVLMPPLQQQLPPALAADQPN